PRDSLVAATGSGSRRVAGARAAGAATARVDSTASRATASPRNCWQTVHCPMCARASASSAGASPPSKYADVRSRCSQSLMAMLRDEQRAQSLPRAQDPGADGRLRDPLAGRDLVVALTLEREQLERGALF